MDHSHLAELKARADYTRQQIRSLAERYGEGVRPSGVSTDLAILHHRLAELIMQIDEEDI